MSYHHLSNITTLNTALRPLDVSTECPFIEGNELDVSSTTYKTYIEHLRNYDDIINREGSMLNQMILSQSRRYKNSNTKSQKGNVTQEVLMKDEIANGSSNSSENQSRNLQQKFVPSTERPLSTKENIILTTQGDERTKNKFQFTEQEVRWALRPKIAVWMASNCQTDSKREDFVAALQRHVRVTTIGKCGEMKCGRNHLDRFCYRWIAGSHLFYLSLENALCDDYTSEKLWRPMEYGMVPIVYGGTEYNKILPPGSYINSQSFQNILALAKYLVYLGNNPVSYLRYLQWRRYWESKEPLPWTCNLCNTLHKVAGVQEQWVTLDQWWNDTS
ncbi:alpha-(1,3)-fucosyltransferase C-like [Macrobrachium rosenbergii]|uniref:alpha-(1,3)-fucosyltransferase C-like n=1 Tax=Macrobrachium rosenbergii TaxID=79674 RepID=UPI0034D52E5E